MSIFYKRVWLSYDLGIGGDYESLYSFLDSHDALECGNSVATFQFPIDKDDDSLLFSTITSDLTKYITPDKRTRIYLIRRVHTDSGDRIKGSFIFGGRKASPWEGASMKKSEDDE